MCGPSLIGITPLMTKRSTTSSVLSLLFSQFFKLSSRSSHPYCAVVRVKYIWVIRLIGLSKFCKGILYKFVYHQTNPYEDRDSVNF
jgi:hypothetical protein